MASGTANEAHRMVRELRQRGRERDRRIELLERRLAAIEACRKTALEVLASAGTGVRDQRETVSKIWES